jgi:hypothetical protein
MNVRACQLLTAAAGLVLAVTVAGTGNALAQDGPIVVGERPRPRNFQLYNYRGALELIWRQRRDELDPPDAPADRFRENRFEEVFTLEADGHIYHPNLVELDLAGSFGLSQTQVDQTGQPGERRDGIINDYDLSAIILRREMAPVTLYTRRSQDQVSRQFGPTLDSTFMSTGAIWDIRSPTVPTRFEIFHSEQKQTGLGEDIGDFSLKQDAFLWHSEYRPRPGHTLTWDYGLSYVQEETEGFSANQYVLHDANLSYSIDFGPGDRSNFTSSLSYLKQSGDFPLERFQWNEFLRLWHSEALQTRYQYTFDRQEFSGVGQDRHRASAGFTHRLFQSLVTNGTVGGGLIEFDDDSQSQNLFGNIQLDYRKQVPLGVLSAFIGGSLDYQVNDARASPTAVVDLPRTFADGAPIILIGTNIDPNTIVITDATRLIVYQEGLDYTLSIFPDRIEIRRILGGRIVAGETVLIDYLVLPQAENVVTTTSFSLGGRYDFERGPLRGAGVYGRFRRQNQDIETDDPDTFIPNEFDNYVFGADYRFGDFRVGAEREIYDSTIAPFEANRYFANYRKRARQEWTLNVDATYQQIEYTDIDNQLDLLTVAGSVVYRVTPRLFLTASIVWRDERDELRGRTRGLEEQLQVNWYHRQTSVYGLIRNANIDSPFQDSSFQVFEIGIRREF